MRSSAAPALPSGAGFAVLDLETTGLSPRTSRVVEIAVVLMDLDCNVVGEMTTLVNPMAHMSATEIHGICARDVRHAPTFPEVAPLLFAGLEGRVPVAHNALFDLRILTAEFARMGVDVGDEPLTGLCTMSLSDSYLPAAPGRSLDACCQAASIAHLRAHTALGDAHATAELLRTFRGQHDELPASWIDALRVASCRRWPAVVDVTAKLVTREQAAYEDATEVPYLARLVGALPRTTGVSALAQSYLASLDRALADRLVTPAEALELGELATALSLGADELLAIHRQYLQSVAVAAVADGVVTPAEMEDLREVTRLLALNEADLQTALTEAASAEPPSFPPCDLSPGDGVVITGETHIVSRGDLEQRTRDAGLRLVSAVSGKTALLVVADPHTQSGKARKARELGTRIVGEAAYLQMLCALEATTGSTPADPGSAAVPAQRRHDRPDRVLASVTPLRPPGQRS